MTLFEFSSAWMLGISTHILSNDQAAIRQCRQLLLDFKQQLENLRVAQKNSSRDLNSDYEMLMQIKIMFENLHVACVGLLGGKNRIQPLIDKSLEIIRCCEKNSNNAADSPCFIAVDLLQVWGVSDYVPFKKSKLYQIQKFLNKSLLARLAAWDIILCFLVLFLSCVNIY